MPAQQGDATAPQIWIRTFCRISCSSGSLLLSSNMLFDNQMSKTGSDVLWSMMNEVLTEHGQITLNQRLVMSHQEVHVAWLLQVRLTGIFNTQTGRLVVIGASKRYAQPVSQRGAVCHLTINCNGSFHAEPHQASQGVRLCARSNWTYRWGTTVARRVRMTSMPVSPSSKGPTNWLFGSWARS